MQTEYICFYLKFHFKQKMKKLYAQSELVL